MMQKSFSFSLFPWEKHIRRDGKSKWYDIRRWFWKKKHSITHVEKKWRERKVCNSLKVILLTATPQNFMRQPFMEIGGTSFISFDIKLGL